MQRKFIIVGFTLALMACNSADIPVRSGNTPVLPVPKIACAPGNEKIIVTGAAVQADAKSYRMIPFQVVAPTNRIEVSYQWTDNQGPPATPLTATTFDLGLWDENGFLSADGFRGWSGSREGRIDQGDDPVFVEEGTAARGYYPGEINPGLWYVDLGIAATAPQGANWEVHIQCLDTAISVSQADNAVDRNHIANSAAGWYHADFHMHAHHSASNAPDNDDFIAQARAAKVDILAVTEYVTGQHWKELGAVQAAHQDLLIWPGREIISYFGHANSIDETPGVLEFRHGFEGINWSQIQQDIIDAGAIFQVNHPTTFQGAAFENLCRGCAFDAADDLDWSKVHTIEVVNAGMLSSSSQVGLPAAPGYIENPFFRSAVQLWDEKINEGHKIIAVSGSDSKGNNPESDRWRVGYGSSVTAIYAENLSRPAVRAGLLSGNVYIRTMGVDNSPELAISATDGGNTITLGETLAANTAELTVTITGANGQSLRFFRDGEEQLSMRTLIISDNQTVVQNIASQASSGSLGTAWRVETVLPQGNYPQFGGLIGTELTTIVANPIFLKP